MYTMFAATLLISDFAPPVRTIWEYFPEPHSQLWETHFGRCRRRSWLEIVTCDRQRKRERERERERKRKRERARENKQVTRARRAWHKRDFPWHKEFPPGELQTEASRAGKFQTFFLLLSTIYSCGAYVRMPRLLFCPAHAFKMGND
jgi:hypothetical protein